jgi:acyl carrier protein
MTTMAPAASKQLELVRTIAADILHVDGDRIVATSRFAEDLGGDDLDMVEIVLELETRLDIALPFDFFFKTVAELVTAVDLALAGKETCR